MLITGSSRGVGAACARAFADRGDRVVVHFRQAADQAAAVLASLPGEGHHLIGCDLADSAAVPVLAAEAAAALGRIDVLVNNAAMFLAPELAGSGSRRGDHRIDQIDYAGWVESWERTWRTNVLGAANLSFLVARQMIEGHRAGRIINVGSRGAYRGEPQVPAYGASKAALHSLGQSLAVALAPYGIGVVSLAPGFIATDMAASSLAGPDGDAIRSQSPFDRVATAEEVAGAIVALADPGMVWASGAVVDFNGASHLR